MELRLAEQKDLPQLKLMYKKIIENMNKNHIPIWDDIYPIEFLQNDIDNHCLYVLNNDDHIVASLALCGSNAGEHFVKWNYQSQKVLYIDRLAVNVDDLRKGMGSLLLHKVIEQAKSKNIDSLRLFVVDINQPAIQLYLKNGFQQVEGIYSEVIDDELVFHEFAFERKI